MECLINRTFNITFKPFLQYLSVDRYKKMEKIIIIIPNNSLLHSKILTNISNIIFMLNIFKTSIEIIHIYQYFIKNYYFVSI